MFKGEPQDHSSIIQISPWTTAHAGTHSLSVLPWEEVPGISLKSDEICVSPPPLTCHENAHGPPVAIPGFQKHSWIKVTKVHSPLGCPVLQLFRTRGLELQRLVQSRAECLGVNSTFLYTLESIRDDPRGREVSQAGHELRGGIHSIGNVRGQQSEEDRVPKAKNCTQPWTTQILILARSCWGFPGGSVLKNLLANAGGMGWIPGSWRCPREGNWQPTPVFFPGESQGWGSLVGCHLWGLTESDTTEAT